MALSVPYTITSKVKMFGADKLGSRESCCDPAFNCMN
jgi:hypothetical protein